MAKKIKYGFEEPVITPDQYVFGSQQLGYTDWVNDGQWDDYLPPDELQKKYGAETMSCVSFGTLNCVEILLNRILSKQTNYSDRALAIMSETTKTGNSPHKVAETLRKKGIVKEEVFPFTKDINSFDEYHSGLTQEHIDEALKWLDLYEFGHDWVFTGGTIDQKQRLLMNALTTSPIGVSVDAWKKKGGYYVKEKGARDNHWCTVYGYKEGKYWKVFDHYDRTKKKLAWDYDFSYAKRYTVERAEPKAYDFLGEIIAFIRDMFTKVINIDQSKKKDLVEESIVKLELIKDSMENKQKKETQQEAILRLAKENLGRDITPEDKVPDEVACAISLTALLKKIDPDVPAISGTWTLLEYFKNSPKFKAGDVRGGNIIINATGTGNGLISGHCGVLLGNDKVASNNSHNGLWQDYYDLKTWNNRYRYRGGMTTWIFKKVS